MKDDLKRFDKDGVRFGQRLHIPYKRGDDPDDIYSSVAYDVSLNAAILLARSQRLTKEWLDLI